MNDKYCIIIFKNDIFCNRFKIKDIHCTIQNIRLSDNYSFCSKELSMSFDFYTFLDSIEHYIYNYKLIYPSVNLKQKLEKVLQFEQQF